MPYTILGANGTVWLNKNKDGVDYVNCWARYELTFTTMVPFFLQRVLVDCAERDSFFWCVVVTKRES